MSYSLKAQVTFQGCPGILGAQNYILNPQGTTNDGGTIRNTYSNGGPISCPAGGCIVTIVWDIVQSRWEIQLNNGSFNDALYFNTTASFPDPPDLTLGTWVENTAFTSIGGGCGGNGTASISTLSGDVQSTTGSGAPEIDVRGNAISIVDGDVTPALADGTNFGNVTLGGNAPQVFTIDNSAGTAALNVSSITLSGGQAIDFAISGITLPATVAAGASTTFTVTFTPSAVGTRSTTVVINNNDANEGVYDFAVQGTGVGQPEIDVRGNAISIVDGDVTPALADGTDFGNVIVGSTRIRTFTIDNSAGTNVLNVSTILLSGPNAGSFSIGGISLPAVVAAGGSTTFRVTFSPVAVGTRLAVVTIANNDANEGTYDFTVAGEGVPFPQVAITEWLSDPTVDDNTDEWVEIYNYGTTPVDLQNWRLRDEDFDNNLITASSFILQPGQYAILARNKASFEADWLQCPGNPNVLQVPMILGNTSDEIILEDGAGNLIWQVSYVNDKTTGRATWYTENTYAPIQWGTKAAPGVVRAGNDVTTGTLGYEKNNATPDPFQITATNGDVGSPFNGALSQTDIARGNALDFDGVNDYIDMGNPVAFNMTNQITLEAWVYPRDVSGSHKIITKFGDVAGDDAYNLEFINGRVAFLLDLGGWQSVSSGSTFTANQWYHIAATYDGSAMRIYVNGVLEGTLNRTGTIDVSASTAKIGGWAGGEHWDGLIDEVSIWNTARSATAIRESIHLTLDGCETGLVAYYQLNENAGAGTAADFTGNLNGTLTNMDPATDWVASGVNIGQDAQRISNAQTLAVPTGLSTQNFANANLSLEFLAHSVAEDFTVTYEYFAPNAVTGIASANAVQVPMWTVNKATSSSAQVVNMTFTYPVGLLLGRKECDYRLYHRPMYSDGAWTEIAPAASAFTPTTVTFDAVLVTGQFLVVADPFLAPSLVRGRVLNFDGNNDEVILGNTLDFDFNTPFSAELWVKVPTTATTNGNFLTKFDGNTLVGYTFGYIGGSGEVNFALTNFGVFQFFEIRSAAGFDVRDGEWHHIAITYDGSGSSTGATLYIDGINRTTIALPGTVSSSIRTAAPAIIGNYSAGTEYFEGQLDELRVWNVQRTELEIRENMHLTQTGCETDLVAYYQFNEPPGATTLPDLARGNDGSLSGINVVTSWQNSGVNVGNDNAPFSNSQTLPVPSGVSFQTFALANMRLDFTAHSVDENITVTYQAFDPNVATGTTGTNVIQNPMWTINKENLTSTHSFNPTFVFQPATLTTNNPCQIKLYYRPMNSEGVWTEIANATTVTATEASFTGINVLGQFMVVEDLNLGADIVRGDVLDFDGINDYAAAPHTTARDFGTGDFTTECWFRYGFSQPNQFPSLLGWRTPADFAYLLYTNSADNRLAVQFDGVNYGSFGPALNDGEWYHVALTRASGEVNVYLNGIVVFTATITADVTSNGDLNIGWDAGNPAVTYFQGQIEEVRIWSLARTAAEIRENMHLTLKGCDEGLLHYYQFNDGAGSATATDAASGNNATLVNMDVNTAWVASSVNVGNDAADISNSQTTAVGAVPGTQLVTFVNANLNMQFIDNTTAEDYTVTYQAFAPNGTMGANGTTIYQNPMWTINKATNDPSPRMNLRFEFPVGTFTELDGTKYRLYWRPMYGDGAWTPIKNYANTVTINSVSFTSIYQTGQFMVVKASDLLISDVRGEMYEFDGANQTIDLGNLGPAIHNGTQVTLEAWVKINQLSPNPMVIIESNAGSPDYLSLEILAGSQQMAFYGMGADIFTVSNVVTTNEWIHVAGVYDGTQANPADRLRLYINGILQPVILTGTPQPALNLPNNFYLGSQDGSAQYLNGEEDEVRIWSVPRTQNEIRENMHLTLKGNESGLVSYYQFNNDGPIGSVGGVRDAMGINDGTTINMVADDREPSEVAVAGGVSERMTINSTGLMSFTIPKVDIDFATSPNGEIVVSRLMTEKPHGWESIGTDVDNEYFVVWNYGTNQAPVINGMTFSELTTLNATTLPSDVGLHKRGSREYGPTWATPIAPASSLLPTFPGSATFTGAPLTTGFSQFVIAQTGGSDLPVELVNFDAERQNPTEVALWWTTALELNNRGFELERMLDGESHFTTVGWVDGKGTTTAMTRYNVVDDNASTAVSYYRLKQIDYDGTVSYSPIRAVEGSPRLNQGDLVLFPNPATDEVRLRLSDLEGITRLDIQLTDIQGRIWRSAEVALHGATTLDWSTPVGDFTPGVYFITLSSLDGKHQWQQKLVVQ